MPAPSPVRSTLLVALALAGASPLASAAPAASPIGASVQEVAARPDQVFVFNARTGDVKPVSGILLEENLDGVTVETTSRKQKFDALEVVRVSFGTAPPSFTDGRAMAERGAWAEAAAFYQVAATDASGRAAVQANARLRAAEMLMRAGATDPASFETATEQVRLFLTKWPEHRLVPRARMLEARSLRLAGDATGATKLYTELYDELSGEEATTGYPVLLVLRAGLDGASSALEAGDTQTARSLFKRLESSVAPLLAQATADEDARRVERLRALQAEVTLGEGYIKLADGDAAGARSFFEGLAGREPDAPGAMRFGIHLGLGEALLALGEHRLAQLEFAQVSALDPSGRDRVARALVGLAEAALALEDKDGRDQARTWLRTVIDEYGDTPPVRRAQELMASL
jgi:tetratricopeptide (TPR) repeat protein